MEETNQLTKEQRIESLYESLEAIIATRHEKDSPVYGLRIYDERPLLIEGNLDAKILVIQLHPDKSELTFSKMLGKNRHVCRGPEGNFLRERFKNVGFNDEKDFVYVNFVPFVPLGMHEYDEFEIDMFAWLHEEIMDIIKPLIVIALGYKVTLYTSDISYIPKKNIMEGDKDIYVSPKLVFEAILNRNHSIVKLEDHFYVPLNDINTIMTEHHNKHKSFFTTTDELFTCYMRIMRKRAA